jgi:DNA-binding CsgD family transcriptional regulator
MSATLKGIVSLSERQKEVLRLTAQHLMAKEIARALNITEHTVKAHSEEARRRLNVATSRQAARLLMEYEATLPIPLEGEPSSRGMSGDKEIGPISGHEQALHSTTIPQRDHDDQLQALGDGLVDARSTLQASTYPGRNRVVEDNEPGPRTGESDLQYGRGRRLVDGRWGEFRGRLKTLSLLQWLGLVLLVSILFPLILAVLVQSATGALQVLQSLHASAG